jgi:hypothetical protein
MKMKVIVAALASAALIAAPLTATAQSHGGSHSSAGHVSGGRGGGVGGYHGYRGGYRGYRGGYYGYPFFWGAGLGLALGEFYAAPWYYGYPYYYYGYPPYDDDGYGPPASGYYQGSLPSDDVAPGAGAKPGSAPAAKACGAWRWDQTAQKYQWVTDGC